MDRKKEIANTGQGNRVGDMGKSADEASALTVYHETMKKTRRRKTPDVRVFHTSYGSVVVPGGSKLIAIQNAARIWGVPYSAVNSAEVWYLPPEERRENHGTAESE